ncbi:MAG: chorismate mutase [Rhodospirillales bacterium]|nr:chorismate mutase [Rhodospirillales bacterium]
MSKTVAALRQQIDVLDNQMLDLLMQRADLVLKIGEEKRKNGIQVVQPDREAVMVRRLLDRHRGPLPREAVVRIWRELVGAVSLLQTGLKVIVTVPEGPSGITHWDMAKDYFSSVLPMARASNALAAVAAVREKEATFAVLPWPEDGDTNPWWRFLIEEDPQDGMRIAARLPLGDRSAQDSNPEHKALVVARLKFEPSGADRSFLALEDGQSISRGRLVDKAGAIGLKVRSIHSSLSPAGNLHLLEVDDYVAADDPRLEELREKLEMTTGKCVCLGGYPVPPVYGDKVGRNAVAGANGKS